MDDANTGERVSVCQPLISPTLHHACQIIDNHVTIDRNGTVVLSRLRWKGDRFPTRSLTRWHKGRCSSPNRIPEYTAPTRFHPNTRTRRSSSSAIQRNDHLNARGKRSHQPLQRVEPSRIHEVVGTQGEEKRWLPAANDNVERGASKLR